MNFVNLWQFSAQTTRFITVTALMSNALETSVHLYPDLRTAI